MPVANPKKNKPQKLSAITNRLDSLVSKIVRLRDPHCVTCGSLSNAQCGHYISRVFVNVRWNLQNCHRQCAACNVSHEQDSVPYTLVMQGKYGPEILLELSQLAHSPTKINRPARLLLEIGLKEMLKKLEDTNGQ
jgi:Bacteriophage Lambda NinG protein